MLSIKGIKHTYIDVFNLEGRKKYILYWLEVIFVAVGNS